MLKFFRNMFKSKIGLAIVLGFVGLIAFAFASADISGSSSFGGIAGGDRVAVVGDTKIGTADLAKAASDALDQARQQDPTMSMEAFVASGGLTDALNALIDRAAFREFARTHGLRAGENLINSEIRQIAAFRGPDGNFSEEMYRRALAQQQLTDKIVRNDISTAMLAQQLLLPATTGTQMPQSVALRYAQLFKERREGSIAALPAAAFAPRNAPTEAQLTAFYNGNKALFIRPERRVIRYATFDAATLGSAIEPTAAEIAARYKQNAAQYAASETRTVAQLIVPTESAAKTIRAKVAAGGSLESAAASAGLRIARIADASRSGLRSQFSAAVSDAYFGAARGAVTEPARSPLGWHVARVESVASRPARTLAQATPEITTQLRTEKRAKGLADLAIRVEGLLDDGATLSEIAKEYKLALTSTKPVIATGQVYAGGGETVAPELAPALANAFQMDEEEPEVAPLGNGETYLLYEVTGITASATAPLAEIRGDVIAAWRQSEGVKAAKSAADRVLTAVAKGTPLSQAVASLKVAGLKVEPVNLTREDLAKLGAQRVPPQLALFFSMAKGTTKKLELPGRVGWTVVDLDNVAVDPIAANDPLVAQARQQLGPLVGQEYADQLRVALREAVGVERNPAAIQAVRKQLLGQN